MNLKNDLRGRNKQFKGPLALPGKRALAVSSIWMTLRVREVKGALAMSSIWMSFQLINLLWRN